MSAADAIEDPAMEVDPGNADPRNADPGNADRTQAHSKRWIWRDCLTIALGLWLLSAPTTFDHGSRAMLFNDIVCGLMIMVLATIALLPRFELARWGIAVVGMWLLLAPLLFWTPNAAAYTNSTLVGALIILFSVIIPTVPGRRQRELAARPGPDTPPGWSYNPSDWMQRGPIIALALVGYFLSRHLASYQLGHIAHPWDPFFGEGTREVLDSEISEAWPVSDAGLGAASYMIEALSGSMGGVARWRTMPWLVLLFGILVIPVGIVSVVLVILQPVVVGAWCALCLITAAAMLLMVSPAMDEVIAMFQFLKRTRSQGRSLWRAFWLGGADDGTHDGAAPTTTASRMGLDTDAQNDGQIDGQPGAVNSMTRQVLHAMDLANVPWNVALCAALGVWLMAAPAVLATTGTASDSDHLLGALVVTFSVIAFSEVVRSARLLNVLFGAWLLVAPWILDGFTTIATVNGLVVGAALIALSLRRGPVTLRAGGWERWIA